MKNEIVLFEAKDGKVSLPVQLNEGGYCVAHPHADGRTV